MSPRKSDPVGRRLVYASASETGDAWEAALLQEGASASDGLRTRQEVHPGQVRDKRDTQSGETRAESNGSNLLLLL